MYLCMYICILYLPFDGGGHHQITDDVLLKFELMSDWSCSPFKDPINKT